MKPALTLALPGFVGVDAFVGVMGVPLFGQRILK